MGRIAVVNDDTTFLDMMLAVLAEAGWEATAYRESSGVVEKLRADPPELVILDIRMESPESGWNVLELLTLDRNLSDIPVIVCSAAIIDLRAHVDWLKQNGIAVLPKPFNIQQLYDCVIRAIGPGR